MVTGFLQKAFISKTFYIAAKIRIFCEKDINQIFRFYYINIFNISGADVHQRDAGVSQGGAVTTRGCSYYKGVQLSQLHQPS